MPRGRGARGARGARRGRGGRARDEVLVRMRRDGHTYRFSVDDPVPRRDVRELPCFHPLVGVKVRDDKLPVAFAALTPALVNGDLMHVRVLHDAGLFRCYSERMQTTSCRHVRSGARKRAEFVGGVCAECRPEYVKATVPLDNAWMPLELCFTHGVLPPSARPSPLWPLFRASAPSERPWDNVIRMAAHGHLAPATPAQLEDATAEFPEYCAQLAAELALPPNVLFLSLWRLFGTNDLTEYAGLFEMPLVERVLAYPGSIYGADGREVSRRDWKLFDTLMRSRAVMRARPDAPTIEYREIRTSGELLQATAQVALAKDTDTVYVNIADDDDGHVTVEAICALISACPCPLALTVDRDLRHPAHYLLTRDNA